MEEVKNWLCSVGLGEYWHNFEKQGWDELTLLTEISDVDLASCITKPGHRAKFSIALRSFTNTSAASGSSASLNSVDDLDRKPFEVDGMPKEKTNHASQLAQVTEITPQLDTAGSLHTARGIRRTDSIGTAREADTKESVDVVRKMDKTDSIDAVREADSVEIVQEVVDVLQIVKENRSETKQNERTSTPARNEVSRFEEANIESWYVIVAIAMCHIMEGSESYIEFRGILFPLDMSYTLALGFVRCFWPCTHPPGPDFFFHPSIKILIEARLSRWFHNF